MHEVLVNPLGGLSLPSKSVARLTDRPDLTSDVYRGRKTTTQQQQQPVFSNYWYLKVNFLVPEVGWSDGAMVLGKLPVLGCPTNFDYSRARAYCACACNRCGWGLFGHFYSRLSFLFLSPSLWEMVRCRLKYCLKGPLSSKQSTNWYQKIYHFAFFLPLSGRWCDVD